MACSTVVAGPAVAASALRELQPLDLNTLIADVLALDVAPFQWQDE